jgi:hypothetical protein
MIEEKMTLLYPVDEIVENRGVSLLFWNSFKEGVPKKEVRVIRTTK